MATKKKTETPKQQKKITGTVFGGGLYIRREPDLIAGINGVLPNGTVVEILEAGTDWHKIKQGYIMSKWVKMN